MKEFFSNLKKSTKITMISCASFIVLTFLILIFFVMFPITPSEKVIASFGRESVAKNEEEESAIVTTAASTSDIVVSRIVTTTAYNHNVSRTNYKITVTTGEGFFSGGYITTGTYSEYTANDDPPEGMWEEPEEEPYYPLPGETTTYYSGEVIITTTFADNGEEPVITEPVTGFDEPTTEPPTNPVEPIVTEPITDAPPESGGEDSGAVE